MLGCLQASTEVISMCLKLTEWIDGHCDCVGCVGWLQIADSYWYPLRLLLLLLLLLLLVL